MSSEGVARVERAVIVWFLIILLVVLGFGYGLTYFIYQPQIQALQNELDKVDENLGVLTANTSAFLESINSFLRSANSTLESISSSIEEVNSTFQLPTYYYWFSGVSPMIELGQYPANDSWTYRDFTIAGYRQVSIYVASADNQEDSLLVRIGMGNFAGLVHPGGYMWATYYNITDISGFNPSLQSTISVQGPQLSIEVYNRAPHPASITMAIYLTR